MSIGISILVGILLAVAIVLGAYWFVGMWRKYRGKTK
jgi:hypothetical protein